MAETTKIFESHLVKQALKDSVLKLNPVYMIKNPIMFVVEVGMLLALGLTIYPDLFHQESVSRLYVFSIFIILLLTLVFANFSEALAEGRGKAQANALRQTQTEMKARRIKQDGSYEMIDASDLKKGDIVRVETGEQIPNDGKVIKGHSFLDKMIGLVEGATRKKTPNEIALFTLLMTLTIIFLVVILTMYPLAKFLNFNLSIAMLILWLCV